MLERIHQSTTKSCERCSCCGLSQKADGTLCCAKRLASDESEFIVCHYFHSKTVESFAVEIDLYFSSSGRVAN